MSDRYNPYDDQDDWYESDSGYGRAEDSGYRSSRAHSGYSSRSTRTSSGSGHSSQRRVVSFRDEDVPAASGSGSRQGSYSSRLNQGRTEQMSAREAARAKRMSREAAQGLQSRTRSAARSQRSSASGDGSHGISTRTSARQSASGTPTRRSRGAQTYQDEAPRARRQATEQTRSRTPRQRAASDITVGAPSYARAKRKGGGKLRIALIAVAVVVALAGIGVFAYASIIQGNMQKGVDQDLRDSLVQTDMAKEPFYMLLMGTDGSAERDADEDFGGVYRSDSIMLARIDPVEKTVTLVSLHRDTKVDLGEYGENKLNAAHAFGGPALVVQTVSKLADVPITHYAEINFDAFCGLVDALGGVEVDVPIDIDDEDAGGSLSAGLQTLNGEQALILCRSRNSYAEAAGDPDEMRAANQRLVLAAIARKLLSSDVATIAASVRTISEHVTTTMDLNDIIGLAQTLQGLDPETDIYSAMQPVEALYEDDTWYAVTMEPEWTNMMNRVKQGLPPTDTDIVDESTGTVLATAGGKAGTSEKTAWIDVKNGTKRSGLATEAMGILNNAGFVNVVVGEANGDNFRETVIVYRDPVQAYEANLIRDALGQGTVVLDTEDQYVFDCKYLVLIGSDWQEGLQSGSASSQG